MFHLLKRMGILLILVIGVFWFSLVGHELAHYAAGKQCGIAVDEVSMGSGPVICSPQFGETTFTFRLVPYRGYTRYVSAELAEKYATKELRTLEQASPARFAALGDSTRWVDRATAGERFFMAIAGIAFEMFLAATLFVWFLRENKRERLLTTEETSRPLAGSRFGKLDYSRRVHSSSYRVNFRALLILTAMTIALGLAISNCSTEDGADGRQVALSAAEWLDPGIDEAGRESAIYAGFHVYFLLMGGYSLAIALAFLYFSVFQMKNSYGVSKFAYTRPGHSKKRCRES